MTKIELTDSEPPFRSACGSSAQDTPISRIYHSGSDSQPRGGKGNATFNPPGGLYKNLLGGPYYLKNTPLKPDDS